MEEIKTKIRNNTETFFKQMGFRVDISNLDFRDNSYFLDLDTNDARPLIGKSGDVLFKIQSLLNKMINKEISDYISLELDINGYKKKREQYLREVANQVANDVLTLKTAKSIAGLSPYERRIVHVELAMNTNIKTESIGEKEDRKLIIKPV